MAAASWFATLALVAGLVGILVPLWEAQAMVEHLQGDAAHPSHPAWFSLSGVVAPIVCIGCFVAWALVPRRHQSGWSTGLASLALLAFLGSLLAWAFAWSVMPAT